SESALGGAREPVEGWGSEPALGAARGGRVVRGYARGPEIVLVRAVAAAPVGSGGDGHAHSTGLAGAGGLQQQFAAEAGLRGGAGRGAAGLRGCGVERGTGVGGGVRGAGARGAAGAKGAVGASGAVGSLGRGEDAGQQARRQQPAEVDYQRLAQQVYRHLKQR